MKTRIITGVVMISLFIPILIFSDTWAFPILIALLSLKASFEILKCDGTKNIALIILSALFASASPILARLSFILKFGFGRFAKLYIFAFFFYLLINLTVSIFSHGKYPIDRAALTFLSIFYTVTSFTCIVFLRDYPYGGKYIYLLTFIAPWISDTFAYFIGSFFGKHKLIEDVSPKKTVEGCIGGIFFTGVTCVVYGIILVHAVHAKFEPSYIALFVIGLVISVISQIGDLAASLIKRHFNVKDYGQIFPGHGGVMDRFDSVFPVAPTLLLSTMLLHYLGVFK